MLILFFFTLSKPISHSLSPEMKFIAMVSPVICRSCMKIQYIIIDVIGKCLEEWLNYPSEAPLY
jgi:hypothetical protein